MSYLGLNTTTDDHAAKASPADVRRKNRQLIFRLLFPTNQYSRAELGRRTGLSRVAVSDVVGRMLEEGLLRETGQAPSGGKGKRGTLLSIDIDRLRIISIDLTQEHLLHGAVTNLLGQPLRHAEVTLNTGSFVSVDVIIELIEKMLGMSDGEVIGIGVASPGVVDNGVVRSSTMRGWNNLDLSTPIAEHFGLEVNVSNDATSHAHRTFLWPRRAEYAFRAHRKRHRFGDSALGHAGNRRTARGWRARPYFHRS